MINFRKIFVLSITFGLLTSIWHLPIAEAQTKPLTYPEIITALNTKVPNSAFKNKTALIDFLIIQVKTRKVEKALSSEMESVLRQSGATDELISAIKANSSNSSKPVQSQPSVKNYSEMSESEKNQFIEDKANEFLDKFGRTEADKISVEGLNLIKRSIESYVKRLSADEKSFKPGNDNGMVSKNSCNYGRGNLADILRRGSTHTPSIAESFVGNGVQPEIGIYTAFNESEFCPCIQSGTGPLGMFQLTYFTAANFGINAVKGATPNSPDDRCNPKAAARGSAKYFKLLADRFYGSGVNGILFSVAAFNAGEGLTNANIRKVKELTNDKQNVTFWDLVENKTNLSKQFQAENYLYVPKFLAAAIIGENPASFGIVEFQPLSTLGEGLPSNPIGQKQTSALDEEKELWRKQRDKALEPRDEPTGLDIEGLIIPEELANYDKQTKALEEMKKQGYLPPMDFFDLAERSLNKELVELPLATETYFLDVGGSATNSVLTKFSFQGGATVPPPNSSSYRKMQEFVNSLSGQKYELNNPNDRKQIRIRLLRMISPKAKAVIEEIAQKYQAKFGRPLRVTSLVRSIDYQIGLSGSNANAFLVKPDGAIPSHCSGLAFDLGYKQMTAEEQNFVAGIIAEMERNGKVDGVRESGTNAALHVFVF